MPNCPSCGTAATTPTKVFSVIVEPREGERGLTQRKVGMYQCAKCGMKFPTVISRQKYLLVGEDQLSKIRKDVQDLKLKISNMNHDQAELQNQLERSRKDAEVKRLEGKLEALERHVAYLRKEKGELEEKASGLR